MGGQQLHKTHNTSPTNVALFMLHLDNVELQSNNEKQLTLGLAYQACGNMSVQLNLNEVRILACL
jgi:hypothetical protein